MAIPVAAQNILLYYGECGGAPSQFEAALSNLGLSYTEVTDEGDFESALTSGDWDLVLIETYSDDVEEQATIDALDSYVSGGGRVAMSNYDFPAGLPEIFDATFSASYNSPLDMNQWTGHPLFSVPNAIPDPLEPSQDTCSQDGGRFDPGPGGTAIGGYTGSDADGEAAIIVGNGGRTVLFGGILGLFNADNDSDGKVDGVEMAENMIVFLIGGAARPADVPTASGWGLLALMLAVAVVGIRLLR